MDNEAISFEKKKEKAYGLVARHPHKVIVDYICEHDGIKYRHHYDYDKPFNVHLLCGHCHAVLHHPKRKVDYNTTSICMRNFPDELNYELHVEAAKKNVGVSALMVSIIKDYLCNVDKEQL